MTTLLLQDGLYFLITFVLATLFAMGGVGSAIALVPTFSGYGTPLKVNDSNLALAHFETSS
ncbi:MAG: hypothetical protein U5K56_19360 [Halioglobus sp.]|nr:hypothetical protein [Halioglobus sp.]